jgi:hypothetical protein
MSTEHTLKDEIGDAREHAHVGVPPQHVTRALLIFYAAALLFNATSLHEQARLMPYGPWRDVCVAISKPFAYVSTWTGLSKPREWIENKIN